MGLPLVDKLELNDAKILSIAGSGGKTTLLYALGRELAQRGKRVAITTTTHIFHPDAPDLPVFFAALPPLLPGRIAVVGQPEGEKLSSPPPEILDELAAQADVLLIEADGSRRLPVKFPRPGEPVLIPQTDRIVVVAGLSALGKPCREVCHRWELARDALDLPQEAVLTPALLARLLIRGYGHLSPTPQVVLNQADILSIPALGEELRALLLPRFPNVTILSLHQEVNCSC